MADELLKVHGMAPGKKTEGVTRLINEKVDRMNNMITNSERNR